MDINCFTRPNKPLTCKRPDFERVHIPTVNVNQPKLITVDSSTECHVTPDYIADEMVGHLNYETATVDTAASSILEPSAGTGQLIKALLRAGILGGFINSIEKNYSLFEHLTSELKGLFVNINQGDFLTDFNEFENEYDRIICNPPFKAIKKHIDQVYKCLKVGGIAVCLVPVGYKKIEHEILRTLPSDTFGTCNVNTKIIRITK